MGIGSTTLADGETVVSFAQGESGGEKTHTLTTGEMPSHTHDVIGASQTTRKYVEDSRGYPLGVMSEKTTSSTGGGAAHNNMPPYITAYCWRRTG